MFTIALYAALAATAPVTASTARMSVAPVVAVGRVLSDSAATHLERARRAQCAGDLETARREYATAATLDRAAGGLAVEASYGLAEVLQQQSLLREAGLVLNHLADEAALRGDAETEAQALLDALWLNAKATERTQARADVARLKALAIDERVSAHTRQQIRARLA